ncbi:GNAT family N-acetyltransferase [Rhodovastum atsumiense]|uniref:GNAT family N-acetyltransferase n=1 Tax=Rhodovastum atsumiense TaxID=504468 RepID=A0A5M6J1J1_9PROT|nr:GNAT family N-acetyltransferase [Rhodovastum atsumiense]KAA5613495.1 GNAT family N-acetyltransferase [Rhodovastum atsumiense]
MVLWPLAIHRKGPLRIARVLTCGTGDEYGGPLLHEAAGRPVIERMLEAVTHLPAEVLQVQVRQGTLLQQCLEAAQPRLLLWLLRGLGAATGYVIRLRDVPRWEDFLASLSSNDRGNLRRRRRLLEARGQVEIGWCTTPGDAEAMLTWLFTTKREWAEDRGIHTRYPLDDRIRDFFIALSRQLDLATTPFITFVKVDGMPVAASLNLIGGHSLEGFVTTYDEAFARYSVGTLLLEFLAHWAHANGRDLDMRPAFGHYKSRWATHEEQYRTLFVFPSARGRLIRIPYVFFRVLKALRGRINERKPALRPAPAS